MKLAKVVLHVVSSWNFIPYPSDHHQPYHSEGSRRQSPSLGTSILITKLASLASPNIPSHQHAEARTQLYFAEPLHHTLTQLHRGVELVACVLDNQCLAKQNSFSAK